MYFKFVLHCLPCLVIRSFSYNNNNKKKKEKTGIKETSDGPSGMTRPPTHNNNLPPSTR